MSALDKVADTGAWGHSPLLQSNIPQVKLIWIPGDKDITVKDIDKKVDQPPGSSFLPYPTWQSDYDHFHGISQTLHYLELAYRVSSGSFFFF
jgi:hypothetical protein